jgi:hypothetical protein
VEDSEAKDDLQGKATTNVDWWLKNKALSRQPRIRRMGELPEFIHEETRIKTVYSHSLELVFKGHNARLRYRRSRRGWVGEVKTVRRRVLFCWVTLQSRRVAALQFFEYDPVAWVTNGRLFDTMDSQSQIESDLAAVLCHAWDSFAYEVTSYGNLVDFRMAWAAPLSPPGLWAAAAEELIAHEIPNYSLLTMKAFPLEYEGRVAGRGGSRIGFKSRQQAMVKYYQRLFGVQRFPGRDGKDGWLFRINQTCRCLIEKPRTAQSSNG